MTVTTLISLATLGGVTGEIRQISLLEMQQKHQQHLVALDNIHQQIEFHRPVIQKWPNMTIHEKFEHLANQNPIDTSDDPYHEEFAQSLMQMGYKHVPYAFEDKKVYIELVKKTLQWNMKYPKGVIMPQNITWDWLRKPAPPLPDLSADIEGIAFMARVRANIRARTNPCPECKVVIDLATPEWTLVPYSIMQATITHVIILLAMVVLVTSAVSLYVSDEIREKFQNYWRQFQHYFWVRVDLVRAAKPKWMDRIQHTWTPSEPLRTRIRNALPVPLSKPVRKVVNRVLGMRTRDVHGRLLRKKKPLASQRDSPSDHAVRPDQEGDGLHRRNVQ